MIVQMDKKEGMVFMKVGEAFTVYEAAEIHGEMKKALETGQGLVIDLSDLGEFDLTGIQILCSASKSAKKAGKRFLIEDVHRDVLDAFFRAGVRLEDLMA